MTTITKAGVYPKIAPMDYHSGSVTPEPAMSSSIARLMNLGCPAKVWQAHPALNPAYEAKTSRTFDLGTACHSYVLEDDASAFVIVQGFTKDGKPSKGYTSDDAKAQRDAAYTAGKVPLLPDEMPMVQSMAAELRPQLDDHPDTAELLVGGTAEASHFWQDKRTGIWCKCRPDWYANGILVNYKTSGRNVGPSYDFSPHATSMGYFQRAAWEIEGIKRTLGEDVRHYVLLCQETEAPYIAVAYVLNPSALEYGAMKNGYAMADFAECLGRGKERKHWPGYREPSSQRSGGLIPLSPPGWAQMADEEYRIMRQDVARAQRPKPDQKTIDRANAMFKPLED